MGMFDTIYLDKAIACKTCGEDILDFQTKEFDNCLNHFRIGSVLAGSRVLSGVIKDEAYCQGCSDAKRHAWTDVYLVGPEKPLRWEGVWGILPFFLEYAEG